MIHTAQDPGSPGNSQSEAQGRQVLLHFDLLAAILHCDQQTPSVRELDCPGEAGGLTVGLGWLGFKIFHRDRPT